MERNISSILRDIRDIEAAAKQIAEELERWIEKEKSRALMSQARMIAEKSNSGLAHRL